MDKSNKEKFHAEMNRMKCSNEIISSERNNQSFYGKHTIKGYETERTTARLYGDEHYGRGESYYKIAGIKCTFGD